MGGKSDMTTAPISLQDLRRRIYVKAKAEPTWRFWGLYVHVCKMEKLQEAYRMAKSNNGHRESMESRLMPSKKAERRVF
jgi:RNA-directed DNA polymerase